MRGEEEARGERCGVGVGGTGGRDEGRGGRRRCEEKLVEEEGAGKGGRGKEVVEGEGDGRTRRNEGGRVRRSWSEWRRKEGAEGGEGRRARPPPRHL